MIINNAVKKNKNRMDVIKQNDLNTIEKAVKVLKEGGVIAFPTETTYGLGCDPRNQQALGKIYRVKGRDQSKAMPLAACSTDQIKALFTYPESAALVAEKYWPGPLTVLLEPADMILRRQMPVFKDGLSAVRVTSHPFLQTLIQAYKFPITATSANLSGQKACLSAEQVIESFKLLPVDCQPDLVIDGGVLQESQPSTLIKIDDDGNINVLRQGAISL